MRMGVFRQLWVRGVGWGMGSGVDVVVGSTWSWEHVNGHGWVYEAGLGT